MFFCRYNQRTLGNFGIDQKLRWDLNKNVYNANHLFVHELSGVLPPPIYTCFLPNNQHVVMLICFIETEGKIDASNPVKCKTHVLII